MRLPMELGLATVHDATIAKQNPFLYTICGIFENHVTLYIGQTRGQTGALGRFAQHLSDTQSNTYIQRLSNLYHYKEIVLGRTDFAVIRFTSEEMFQIDSPVYREAVEDLVQRRLLNWIAEQKLKICIVSRTRPNSYNKLQNVQEEAEQISSALEPWIMECYQVSLLYLDSSVTNVFDSI